MGEPFGSNKARCFTNMKCEKRRIEEVKNSKDETFILHVVDKCN